MYSKRLSQIDALASNSLVQINSSGTAIVSTAVVVSSAGIVTLPLTPMLTASLSATTGGVTGNAASYVVVFDTVIQQQGGSNLNTSTGIYSCPTGGDGTYMVGGAIGIGSLTAAMSQGLILITTTARSYQTSIFNYGAMRDSANQLFVPFSQMVTLAAADTLKITLTISGGASNVATVLGGTPFSYLSLAKVA